LEREFLAKDSERQRLFNSGMRSLASPAAAERYPYPFDKMLTPGPVDENEIVLVDVGGGRGQALERILKAFPKLYGRCVLQDQTNVIEEARDAGLSLRIDLQAASFFEPNPVKGARAYHFRRIFHDWVRHSVEKFSFIVIGKLIVR
jgi:hypothetical protein